MIIVSFFKNFFQAFVKLVQMEQEKAERQRQKEEEERRRKREEKQRMKRMLEASFDGDCDEMSAILKEVGEYLNSLYACIR